MQPNFDRDKLRAAVRKLGNEYVFYMLDDAIELLSPAKLCRLAKNNLDLKRLQAGRGPSHGTGFDYGREAF